MSVVSVVTVGCDVDDSAAVGCSVRMMLLAARMRHSSTLKATDSDGGGDGGGDGVDSDGDDRKDICMKKK